MIRLVELIASSIATIITVEMVLRIHCQDHMADYFTLLRKAYRIFRSKEISEHWKEIALPAYAQKIFTRSILAFILLVIFLVLFCAIYFLVANLIGATPVHLSTLTDPSIQVGIIVFAIIYVFFRSHR